MRLSPTDVVCKWCVRVCYILHSQLSRSDTCGPSFFGNDIGWENFMKKIGNAKDEGVCCDECMATDGWRRLDVVQRRQLLLAQVQLQPA